MRKGREKGRSWAQAGSGRIKCQCESLVPHRTQKFNAAVSSPGGLVPLPQQAWRCCVTMSLSDMETHPCTASYNISKRKTGNEVLWHREGAGSPDVNERCLRLLSSEKPSGEVPLRLDSLYCSKGHWGRGVTKTFIYVDIHPSTASCVKGKERKRRE